MPWIEDLPELAIWALQREDLRYRFLYAVEPTDLPTTSGIEHALETSVVLAIYEAAIAMGYRDGATIGYEVGYPGATGNPRRSDLAFKDPGPGKNWGYVEVKCYDQFGKSAVEKDIEKLRGITRRSQRWMLVYRSRATEGRAQKLKKLLNKNFSTDIEIEATRKFVTVVDDGEEGVVELALFRVKNA